MITCLEDQLRRDEGWKSYPYYDTAGKLTIGWGRNLADDGISNSEGDVLLANDIKNATVRLESTWPWAMGLDAVRKGAMLNLVFNMGARKLAGFVHFLDAMKSENWEEAKAQLLNSAADHQEPERINRLALQIQTGTWQ